MLSTSILYNNNNNSVFDIHNNNNNNNNNHYHKRLGACLIPNGNVYIELRIFFVRCLTV